jgi:hypothetical protein
VLNKSHKIEVFDLEVDFPGVYAILSTTFNQSCDEIYKAETTFLLKSEGAFVGSSGILMACGKGKAREKHGMPTRPSEVHAL